MKSWHLGLILSLLTLSAAAQDYTALCREEAQRGQVQACQKAIAVTPRDPDLHALLGQAYFASGLYNQGLKALREAVITSNGATEHRYRYAGFAALINEYPKAAQELELIVAAEPGHLKAWTLLADCYRYMKNRPDANRAGRKAAELGDPAEAYILAVRYNSGEDIKVDPAEELRWLERSAKAGYAAAIQDLVRFYADGRPGMPPDATKRDYWQRKAKKLN
ncbi:sel1 repeat family protein [Ferrovibrio terrae]|uniref:Sel1 repeat family protein n=1 Tax=Ferrovibrio terrae TaxID=2594003 RepID=A0A516H497_9PROT|nr:sel1 repeat family protein [Ferrovibrio terrae]QDO98624.1 sel1 repeat family protein [Ferrovibrio terrae]